MKKLIRNICILLLIISPITNNTLYSQDIPQGMISAIKNGNAKELSAYFNTNIELTLLNNEEIYSKDQAELILKDFFTKNVPVGFTVLHKGGKESSRYAIGRMNTSNGNFRITLFIKTQGEQIYIHQLRIEKENAE